MENQGILKRLYKLADEALKSIYEVAGKPYFVNSYDPNSSIDRQLRTISDQMRAEQGRLQKIEERYYRQFSQLESLLGKMNSQSMWLSQQINMYGNG